MISCWFDFLYVFGKHIFFYLCVRCVFVWTWSQNIAQAIHKLKILPLLSPKVLHRLVLLPTLLPLENFISRSSYYTIFCFSVPKAGSQACASRLGQRWLICMLVLPSLLNIFFFFFFLVFLRKGLAV